jgi:hypothetical protein
MGNRRIRDAAGDKLLRRPLNVLGFETLPALDQLKAHDLTLVQGLETAAGDLGMVHKDILTGILNDEAESLFIVEPFDFATGHTVLRWVSFS